MPDDSENGMGGGMKMSAVLAASALALSGTTGVADAAPRKPVRHASTDWTTRVTLTAEGGFLTGNPAAKAKLVEYGSLTCPHCQRSYLELRDPLRARIATGRVSFEFRPLAVHSADPVLHVLLRCAGAARFTRFVDDFFVGQNQLAAAWEQWAEANPTTNPNADGTTRIKFAEQWGFLDFAAKHGVTAARAKACLTPTAMFAEQEKREDAAAALGVSGTPTYFLNDRRLDAITWPDIDTAIGGVLTG